MIVEQYAEISAGGRNLSLSACDRTIPAGETVRRMRPHLAVLGITRVARQTGLDRLGIPCWAAFRPNAATISNSQGKGLTDDAACASAIMEAAEFAVAEGVPPADAEWTSFSVLAASGRTVFDARRLMPIGTTLAEAALLPFISGYDLVRGTTVMVPYDAVCITTEGGRSPELNRSTNGLASGNTESEAILHALCELVERDATTLMGLAPDREPVLVDPNGFDDPEIETLAAQVAGADMELFLFEETTDLLVPCFRAIIGDPSHGYARRFDLAAGYGCHPVAASAAIRAITEAAQTRVTNIAGSRDDFLPAEYTRSIAAETIARLHKCATTRRLRSGGLGPDTTLTALLTHVHARLAAGGIGEIVSVPLPNPVPGLSVVKLFAPQLEDRASNRNWRPGPRALRRLLRSP